MRSGSVATRCAQRAGFGCRAARRAKRGKRGARIARQRVFIVDHRLEQRLGALSFALIVKGPTEEILDDTAVAEVLHLRLISTRLPVWRRQTISSARGCALIA
jgi:hypothetical protein